jgi:hypothetical protein
MMREILERFRYRFQLWQREQREDRFRAGPTDPREPSRDISHYRDPRNTAIITESTSRFAVRVAAVFLSGIAILAVIDSLVAMTWPSARHAVDIIVLVFIGVWIIGVAFTVLDMCNARQIRRDKAHKKI